MAHLGCKHLDYETKFINCELQTTPEGWKWWTRRNTYPGARVNVQFCKLRGRINDVFSCINPNERDCFEAQEKEKENGN